MISEPRRENKWQILLTTSLPCIFSMNSLYIVQILPGPFPKKLMSCFDCFLTALCLSSKFNPILLSRSLSPISNATYFIKYSVDHIFLQTRAPRPFPYHQLISTFLNCQFILSVSHLGFLLLYTVYLSFYLHKLLPLCRPWKYFPQIISCEKHLTDSSCSCPS